MEEYLHKCKNTYYWANKQLHHENLFKYLSLESKFSAFWPNSVGLISKTIQPIYPKFCIELAKGVNYINVLGIFFYLCGSGEILQKLPVIDAKQQFQLCNSIKKWQHA